MGPSLRIDKFESSHLEHACNIINKKQGLSRSRQEADSHSEASKCSKLSSMNYNWHAIASLEYIAINITRSEFHINLGHMTSPI